MVAIFPDHYVIHALLEMVYISDMLESAGSTCFANFACPFPTLGSVVSCQELKIGHDRNIYIVISWKSANVANQGFFFNPASRFISILLYSFLFHIYL